MSGKRLQRLQRIFDDEQRGGEDSVRQRSYAGQRNDSSDGAALDGASDEVVSIQALAAHGKEQLASTYRPRVNRIALGYERADAHGACWSFQLGAAPDRGFG